ncbi:Cof-type HAD-IIB family hydrolase [Paenibacillus sp. HN-1]|uniref:Cof-type HAD-IIB family hydrolase n=1 Tax=Paenibacillus TaxID=44249 RepID=UPI001CA7DD01|nr:MULTISPECIES: Cof-type HAD-IIB family hydrolase [Paenibacillus]MBY9079429.1 Cof-type HAD-IIB family hydrolase [Paenibacillus sp. CGMCC 1.18879]MBY9085724.1 Cof-type HAD-IIB family hydrolase [Paenibacillus sinensis]
MIKLIVSDLDGTLLDRNRQISETDRIAVKDAQQSGYEICFASGRMFTELQMVMNTCEGRFHAVSQNGSTVHTKDFVILSSSFFNSELAVQLLKLSRTFQTEHFIYSVDDCFYLEERTERILPLESRIMSSSTERKDLEDALQLNEIIACRFSYFGELEKLRLMQTELARLFQDEIAIYISDKDCLEVMPARVSKAAGLAVLVKHLGLQPNEVACVGDSFNDIPMFSFTPHSFAMITAPDEVKKEARHVVSSVAEAIQKIHILNSVLG